MGDIIRSHNLDFHVYADDVQVYISFNPKEPNAAMEALRKLELCIMDLKNWMKTNKFMLNNNKTEFFIAGSRLSIQRLPPVQLQVGDSTITPSCHIWNLGVMFDTHMTMSKQVSAIVSSANYQLRDLWRLHRYLDQETRHQVVRALILSRLDYGNALLYGITSLNSNAFSQFRTNLQNSYSLPRDVTALLHCYTHCTGYPFVNASFSNFVCLQIT